MELYKPQGRKIELGLEPGTYEVRIERPAEAWLAKSQIANGQRLEMELEQFSPTKPEPSRRRGFSPPRFGVAGRNRIELRLGMWRGGSSSAPPPTLSAGTDTVDFLSGLQVWRCCLKNIRFRSGHPPPGERAVELQMDPAPR